MVKQWNLSKSSKYGGERKVEPTPKAINPGGVSQWGEALGNHVTEGPTRIPYRGEPVYLGRGYKAPMNKAQSRNRGSQGSY